MNGIGEMAENSPTSGSLPNKVKTEEDNYDDFLMYEEEELEVEDEGFLETDLVGKRRKRLPGPSGRSIFKRPASKPLLSMHWHTLSSLVEMLMREHRWKEASGIMSTLLRGTSSSITEDDYCRIFTAAMELNKLYPGGESRYQTKIKQIYEIWMSKLSWCKNASSKKNLIQVDLALFYLAQGNVQEADNTMKFVIQDDNLVNEPCVNLLYGMILYQLWYSSLPEEIRIKDFDTGIPLKVSDGLTLNDDFGETEIGESSNGHYAVDTEDVRFSSQYFSESSVGNNKAFLDKYNVPRKKGDADRRAELFYMSLSTQLNERKEGSTNHDNNLNYSIFYAPGLDTNLLPIRLKQVNGDMEQVICRYRELANEHYMHAVKHLRLALHSTSPVLAALVPLIQLLLLGDRVEEAFKELESSCLRFDAPLPFRLMARLLECFQSNKVTKISSCYENVLKRDPMCNHSLERLIKMHKNGNYSTILLTEMIALHLDSTDGKCGIWEEFASCFLKLVTAELSEYEECTSVNVRRIQTTTISSNKIPKAFTEGDAGDSWRMRCRWWIRRHFGSKPSLTKMQLNDRKLLCFKAACASHLYGPRFEYVIAALGSLRQESDTDHMSLLCSHMQKSMKLNENLNGPGQF